ncbi:quinone oxidoreductase, putative [Ixodes scapularis]|uniref:Quinone oxidoreductase, putative n=1 Tax=Ixodes scapularis TaxID=6945 RepID=B7PCR9_IXOSC|nr:quinone oxidoreductase, putative [Ixodes scapularis]|eukprot:XP_002410163.1 quinone oxidoreductase, putative [Ixodes scapularis]
MPLLWSQRAIGALVKRGMHALPARMKAWQTHKFGGIDDVLLEEVRVPQLRCPRDVLIKIHAASVNPLDVAMMDGYGRNIIDVLRSVQHFPYSSDRFPLILGRDFSGEVVAVGQGVKHFQAGDEACALESQHIPYSHRTILLPAMCQFMKKINTLSHLESAAIPYAGLTAWAAIRTVGNVSRQTASNKRQAESRGSGGIGTFAIQLLKAWNASVTTTCSSDAVELLSSLGADYVVDYTSPDFEQQLRQSPRFDFILDCVGTQKRPLATELLRKGRLATCVTVVSPVLKNTDDLGLLPGLATSALQALQITVKELMEARSVRWAFFCPNANALEEISGLVELGKIAPVIQDTFPFEDVPGAYRKIKEGHARGKTVVSVVNKDHP